MVNIPESTAFADREWSRIKIIPQFYFYFFGRTRQSTFIYSPTMSRHTNTALAAFVALAALHVDAELVQCAPKMMVFGEYIYI